MPWSEAESQELSGAGGTIELYCAQWASKTHGGVPSYDKKTDGTFSLFFDSFGFLTKNRPSKYLLNTS